MSTDSNDSNDALHGVLRRARGQFPPRVLARSDTVRGSSGEAEQIGRIFGGRAWNEIPPSEILAGLQGGDYRPHHLTDLLADEALVAHLPVLLEAAMMSGGQPELSSHLAAAFHSAPFSIVPLLNRQQRALVLEIFRELAKERRRNAEDDDRIEQMLEDVGWVFNDESIADESLPGGETRTKRLLKAVRSAFPERAIEPEDIADGLHDEAVALRRVLGGRSWNEIELSEIEAQAENLMPGDWPCFLSLEGLIAYLPLLLEMACDVYGPLGIEQELASRLETYALEIFPRLDEKQRAAVSGVVEWLAMESTRQGLDRSASRRLLDSSGWLLAGEGETEPQGSAR